MSVKNYEYSYFDSLPANSSVVVGFIPTFMRSILRNVLRYIPQSHCDIKFCKKPILATMKLKEWHKPDVNYFKFLSPAELGNCGFVKYIILFNFIYKYFGLTIMYYVSHD